VTGESKKILNFLIPMDFAVPEMMDRFLIYPQGEENICKSLTLP
jgi:hypothetical protein